MRIWMTYSQSVSARYIELMRLFYFYRLKRFISVYTSLGPKRTQSGWKYNFSNVKPAHWEYMSLPKAGHFHLLHCFVCFPSTAWKHICFSVLQSASGSRFLLGSQLNFHRLLQQFWGNCTTPGPSMLINTHAFSLKGLGSLLDGDNVKR